MAFKNLQMDIGILMIKNFDLFVYFESIMNYSYVLSTFLFSSVNIEQLIGQMPFMSHFKNHPLVDIESTFRQRLT